MNEEDKELIATAYHEAGHVVAAFLRGRSIKEVTIKPLGAVGNWEFVGGADFGKWANSLYDDQISIADEQTRYDCDTLNMASYAGLIMEEQITGDVSVLALSLDHKDVEELTNRMFNTEEERMIYKKELIRQTYDLTRALGFQEAVEALANALLEKKTLSGEQIAVIIEDALSEEIVRQIRKWENNKRRDEDSAK